VTVSETKSISVGYSGVHNAYQQALAGFEAGALHRFYCTMADSPGCLGGNIRTLVRPGAFASRAIRELPHARISEYPWPVLTKMTAGRLGLGSWLDWHRTNDWFDSWMARQIAYDPCSLFLGYETCTLRAFEAAHAKGAKCLLDIPQFHPTFLHCVLTAAAEKCKIPVHISVDTPAMAARKEAEFATADHAIVYSELQKASFEQAGMPAQKIHVVPLWYDPAMWFRPATSMRSGASPLKLLFVGACNLRKGLPFLFEAVRLCRSDVSLTIVGLVDNELAETLSRYRDHYTYIGPKSKPELRALYASHDILVLPSVADAFGFVALEAMACGMPVVVTTNCGVPVPDPAWVVTAMEISPLIDRFQYYLRNRSRVEEDGLRASQFASGYTASAFRARMRALYHLLLGK